MCDYPLHLPLELLGVDATVQVHAETRVAYLSNDIENWPAKYRQIPLGEGEGVQCAWLNVKNRKGKEEKIKEWTHFFPLNFHILSEPSEPVSYPIVGADPDHDGEQGGGGVQGPERSLPVRPLPY